MYVTPQAILSDAFERVVLDPAVAALSPQEQILRAALLIVAESSSEYTEAVYMVGVSAPFDLDRYTTALKYIETVPDEIGGEDPAGSVPYYYGWSVIRAFEQGAIWQANRSTETLPMSEATAPS